VIPKITLEPLNPDHAQALFDLTRANKQHLTQWIPLFDLINSYSDIKNYIASSATDPASGAAVNFAIRQQGALCGIVGFHEIIKKQQLGSLAYWLAHEQQGKGIMTQAVNKLLNIGFTELHLNKVEIRCAVDNRKSRAIPERLGFLYETTLQQREWLYTKHVDHAVYSMLATEYQA